MTAIKPRPYMPDVAIPPGATIRDVLEAKGMTQQDLADRMGRPTNKINEIIQGKRSITVETALALELVLGWPAHFWLELEKNFQLAKARLAAKQELQEQTAMLRKFPVAKMIKLGWIKKQETTAEQVREMLAFFGITSFSQLQHLAGYAPAFRKAPTKDACPFALAAWLRQGSIQASQIKTETFSMSGLRACIGKMRALSLLLPDQFQPRLVELCAAHGVAVVFVPHLPKSYVCGAAYWLGDKAVIQLSMRFGTDDHFWFSFFHEVGHVLLHGKKETFLDDFKTDTGDKEQEANDFASKTLIPDKEFQRLVQLPYQKNIVIVIEQFAQEINIAPGIVIGRLQHDGLLTYNTLLNGLKRNFKQQERKA